RSFLNGSRSGPQKGGTPFDSVVSFSFVCGHRHLGRYAPSMNDALAKFLHAYQHFQRQWDQLEKRLGRIQLDLEQLKREGQAPPSEYIPKDRAMELLRIGTTKLWEFV